MIRWMLLVALAAGTLALPAVAQDNRLVSRAFDPNQVIKLDGKLNVQTTISFEADEHIENVAVGDSENWQITPNRRADLLFVKPLADNVRTNMTVVTDRRTYFFDLVASPTAKPVYALRLTYSGNATASAAPSAPVAIAARSPVVAQPAPKSAPDPAPDPQRAALEKLRREVLADPVERPTIKPAASSEFEAAFSSPAALAAPAEPEAKTAAVEPASPWKQTGPEDVGPIRIRDDGTSTYLRLSRLTKTPAIYARGADDVLTKLPVTRKDGELVILGVPAQLVVGDGRKRVYLVRDPAVTAAP